MLDAVCMDDIWTTSESCLYSQNILLSESLHLQGKRVTIVRQAGEEACTWIVKRTVRHAGSLRSPAWADCKATCSIDDERWLVPHA